MSRRLGRRPRSSSGELPLLTQLANLWDVALVASRHRIDAGKVGAFIDLRDPTHEFAQADPAKQPALPAADAALGGQVSSSFSGVEYLQSNRSAASWNAWHNGAGGSSLHVFVPTAAFGYFLASRGAAGATGILMAFNTAGNFVYQVHRGVTTVVSAATGTPALNTGAQMYASYWDTASGGPAGAEYVLDPTGAAAATGDSASTPDAGAPAGSMMLGARTDGTFPATMRWWGSFFKSTQPSAANLARAQQIIQQLTTIAP